MAGTADLAEKIRDILAGVIPAADRKLESTLRRIMEIVDPFERAARVEMEHFRSTFAELAK